MVLDLSLQEIDKKWQFQNELCRHQPFLFWFFCLFCFIKGNRETNQVKKICSSWHRDGPKSTWVDKPNLPNGNNLWSVEYIVKMTKSESHFPLLGFNNMSNFHLGSGRNKSLYFPGKNDADWNGGSQKWKVLWYLWSSCRGTYCGTKTSGGSSNATIKGDDNYNNARNCR